MFAPPTTSKRLLTSTSDENVDTPATFKSSNCVSPSTSKVPFASIFPFAVRVPSTVRFELKSAVPKNS